MEKLLMCRICLVKHVRMYAVVHRNLHELYEKLTGIPFVTEDSRPILVCSFCCVKLKQCYRLLRKCLEAEEQFALMMNKDYEPNPLINKDHIEFYSGYNKSPIQHISIVDECQTESIAIKEELTVVWEGLDVIIDPKEDHKSDELEPENLHNSGLDVADIPPQHSESDSEDDVPLLEYKTEVVDENVSEKKRRASESKPGVPTATVVYNVAPCSRQNFGMSGHDLTRRSVIPQNIKNILCLANLENLDQQLNGANTNRRKTGGKAIIKSSHYEQDSSSTDKILQKVPKKTYFFVVNLYARDYCMTSEFFQYFCETETTGTSHHFNNISTVIDTLKGSRISHVLLNGMTEAQQEADLFSAESMPIIDNPALYTQPVERESQQETRILSYKETVPINSFLQDFTLSPTKSNDGDYDLDDSVKDKNYEPIEDDRRKDDTYENIETNKPKTTRKRSKTIKTSKFTPQTKPLRRYSMETIASNSLLLQKRRMTIDANFSVSTHMPSEQAQASNDLPPKRQKYSTSLNQRKLEKQYQKQCQYKIKNGCENKCLKKCSSVFTPDDREKVHRKYWNMTRSEMRVFIRSHYTVAIPKRKYTAKPKRNPKRCFSLPRPDGTLASVCKIFFLTTLGFKKTNDRILSSCLDDTKDIDKRGKHIKTRKFDREVITKHVESFNPSAPHYRREHAPNRRYLPSEINVKFMYNDFCTKHPDVKIGYEMYRTHLKSMNISFARRM